MTDSVVKSITEQTASLLSDCLSEYIHVDGLIDVQAHVDRAEVTPSTHHHHQPCSCSSVLDQAFCRISLHHAYILLSILEKAARLNTLPETLKPHVQNTIWNAIPLIPLLYALEARLLNSSTDEQSLLVSRLAQTVLAVHLNESHRNIQQLVVQIVDSKKVHAVDIQKVNTIQRQSATVVCVLTWLCSSHSAVQCIQ